MRFRGEGAGIRCSLSFCTSLRIVTIYEVFNHTIDEPAHIATSAR
jgi:hypothetical protein